MTTHHSPVLNSIFRGWEKMIGAANISEMTPTMQIDRERLARVCAKALTGGSLSSPKSIDHAAVTAVLADIAAQGFVIVPREPTEAMQDAGLEAGCRFGKKAMIDIYTRMISASASEKENK